MSAKPEDGSSSAVIRLATEVDAEQIAAIYAPNVTDTVISFETEPPTAEEEMRRGIGATLKRYPWLVLERHDGRLLGYAYARATLPNPASIHPTTVAKNKLNSWKSATWETRSSFTVRTTKRHWPRP